MPQNINFAEINFPEKHYLHKNKTENIHIYNLRRALPRMIPADIYEEHLVPKLTREENEFLAYYYVKRSLELSGADEGGQSDSYILRSLPVKILEKDMHDHFEENHVREEDRDFIFKFYEKSPRQEAYVLARNFNELEELKIARILHARNLFINDADKTRISDILERCERIEKDDEFIANMHVDPEHEYFFEHRLDHIPGMMVIETARQMFTACAHIYGKVPLEGIFFTLNSMNVNFSEYLWMSYPIRIDLHLLKKTFTDTGYWHMCSCRVSFHQEFREKGRIEVDGMTIKKDVLEEITIKKQVKDALKYNTLPGVQSEVFLKDERGGVSYVGAVVDISPKHLMVEFFEDVQLDPSQEFDFRINLEKHFYSYGVCVLRRMRKSGKRVVANFLITHLDEADSRNINEIIKRLCHIREQKGIL